MAVLHCEDIQLLLKLHTPLGHQVDILQHHPMPFAVSDVQLAHSNDILSLTHGDVPIVLTQAQAFWPLLAHRFHLFDRVCARRQDEEDGRSAGRILKGVAQDCRKGEGAVAVHVVSTIGQCIANPLCHGSTAPVGSQGSENQQLLEGYRVQSLPIQWQLHLFWRNLIEPLFEAVGGILLHVLREALETLQVVELQNHAPVLCRQPILQWVFHAYSQRCFEQVVEIGHVEILLQEPLLEQLEGEHRTEDQLVALKESTIHPAEDGHTDDSNQPLNALSDVVSRLCAIDGFVQEVHEGIQRKLVHVLDEAQLNDQEEQHRTLRSDRTVELSRRVDFYLCFLSLLYLDGNLLGGGFGLLQTLDQRNVVKNCRRICRGKLGQQIALKLRQGDLEIVLSTHQLLLLLLQLWLLDIHDHSQDLVLQTIRCDNKVDDRTLSSNLRPVVWVWQLRLQVELEFGIVVHLFTSNLDDHRTSASLNHSSG
mmetsp:Transcript_43098/g.100602  ORF Transcript_43098/g.100602 Transcript_43098/m.100602 type:complete len:479 (-) Transcript_43098:2669-4105(-)